MKLRKASSVRRTRLCKLFILCCWRFSLFGFVFISQDLSTETVFFRLNCKTREDWKGETYRTGKNASARCKWERETLFESLERYIIAYLEPIDHIPQIRNYVSFYRGAGIFKGEMSLLSGARAMTLLYGSFSFAWNSVSPHSLAIIKPFKNTREL